MKNLKVFGLVFALAFVLQAGFVYAADLVFNTDTTVVINNVDYTIKAGSRASSMTSISDGTVSSSSKIADSTGGFGTLVNGDVFGVSLTSIGDLNGDGVNDLAVGAPIDSTGGSHRGAVYILFMNTDGTVASKQKIADSTGGFGVLTNSSQFGQSIASLGDLNGDGIPDLAVGANGDGGKGAVYVLFMNADGTVSSTQKIADSTGGFGVLTGGDGFGWSISSIGDLNGDGIPDLAVGAAFDSTGGALRGSVYILFMNADGTVASSQKIANNTGGFGALSNVDVFGSSVSSIGDLNGDDIPDLAVGAYNDSTGGASRGAAYILFMNTDGTVASSKKIADNTGGFGTLTNSDNFGYSVSSVGDLNGDGFPDLAVGAYGDDTGGSGRGAFYILFLNTDGTVTSSQKIASGTGGFGTLVDGDDFGDSIASVGDLNGDGVIDLAVGANNDDTGGSNRGAVYILFMTRLSVPSLTVTVPSGYSFTLESPDRYKFSDITNLSFKCTDTKSILVVGSGLTTTITPVADTCSSLSGGGSWGGGGSYTPPPVVPAISPVTPPPATPDLGCSVGNLFSTQTGNPCTPNTFNPPTNVRPSYNFGPTTLKQGSTGDFVMELQRFLNVELNLGLIIDGKLGPKTIVVIKEWQKNHGLVADGFVGPLTKGKMMEVVQ